MDVDLTAIRARYDTAERSHDTHATSHVRAHDAWQSARDVPALIAEAEAWRARFLDERDTLRLLMQGLPPRIVEVPDGR